MSLKPILSFTLVAGAALLCCVHLEAKVRYYYIAAEPVVWDYAPSGRDLVHNRSVPPKWTITKWEKVRYVEYTDRTFTARKPQPEWLGILGPIIRAEVGDEIVVSFWNRTRKPHSIHPHGLRYDKADEGAHYFPGGSGAMVPAGGRFEYHWHADEESGPGPGDPSSIVWWYHPHVDESTEANAGLLGPIIISAAGRARSDGRPRDVDREFVVCFMIFDEKKGLENGLFHALNGYVFGNLTGLVMKKGEKVRWHLLAMGNERDLHTAHWHGKTVHYGRRHTDVIELLPASQVTVDMFADNVGTWLFHCQVSDHMEAGMMTTYTIQPRRSCPVNIVSGDFWDGPSSKFRFRFRNNSSKTILNSYFQSAYFHGPGDLYSYQGLWRMPLVGSKPASVFPGKEQVWESENYLTGSESPKGWVLFPSLIEYQDGTVWKPKIWGECFRSFWKERKHPKLSTVPPMHSPEEEEEEQ